MRFRLFFLILCAALAAPLASAQTAKSRATLYTEIDAALPSGTGAITASALRAQLKNVVASAFNTINADAQPIDADLTAIAALTTTTYGRSLLTQADAAATRTTLGLGTLATQSGTFSGTSSGTNTGDQTISITGDGTASGSTGALSLTVTRLNGTALSGLATGLLKNTTATGVPSIAVAGTDYLTPTGSGASLTALNATQLTSGTMPAARLPAFAGEATSSAGSAALTLTNSAVIGKVLTGYASTTGAVAATDTILGAIGKLNGNDAATRNALAPAQGIALNGTPTTAVTGPTFGSSDFSISFRVRGFTTGEALISVGGATLFLNGSTTYIEKAGGTGIIAFGTGLLSFTFAGQVDYTRSGTTGTLYFNGNSVATITDANVYTGTSYQLGGGSGRSSSTVAGFTNVYVFNRALSATEVKALYDASEPASTDNNTASNTNLNTGFTNSGYDTFSGASATGFTAVKTTTGAGTKEVDGSNIGTVVVGQRIRVAFTLALTSGTLPTLYIGHPGVGFSSAQYAIAAGANIIELVCTVSRAQCVVVFISQSGDAVNYAVSGLSATRLGLLCALDPLEPGLGYQWHDTSGNKLDPILPASGPVFLLPQDRPQTVRATLTWAGTHEAKSLLGQVALPPKAVITSIITEATVASSGSGLTVGSVTTPALFVAANTYTTARKVHTLAAQLPAGTATNDLSLVLDPDTAAYTGTINVWVNYTVTN